MELQDALGQISEIRQQIARSGQFRGYRSVPVAVTSLVAFLTAAFQALVIPVPLENVSGYVMLWISAAVVCLSITLGDVWRRYRHSRGLLHKEVTRLAIEQFLPSVAAGGLITLILLRRAPETAWQLPGLWSVLFSLGLFASFRLLPRAIFWVATYYLLAGCAYLCFVSAEDVLSPWSMALLFGGGQLATAAVLLASESKQG